MRHRPGLLVATLFAGLSACAQEATAPQGAAGISRVVPIAVPDMWCPDQPSGNPDSNATKGTARARAACERPGGWTRPPGSPGLVTDSTWWVTPDTTK
jgi:hypothetical protein